jgi:hypothetical protein
MEIRGQRIPYLEVEADASAIKEGNDHENHILRESPSPFSRSAHQCSRGIRHTDRLRRDNCTNIISRHAPGTGIVDPDADLAGLD